MKNLSKIGLVFINMFFFIWLIVIAHVLMFSFWLIGVVFFSSIFKTIISSISGLYFLSGIDIGIILITLAIVLLILVFMMKLTINLNKLTIRYISWTKDRLM